MKKLIATIVSLTLLLSMFVVPARAATEITDVSVEIVAPTSGKIPKYDGVKLGHTNYVLENTNTEYTKNGIIWYDGDNAILPTKIFEIGGIYTVRFGLQPADANYIFAKEANLNATINGQKAYIQYMNDSYLSIEYTFPAVEGYTITFDAGNGSGTMAAIENVEGGNYVLPDCTFTPPSDSKEFKAWKVSGTTGEFFPGEKAPVYDNVTITALWKEKSTRQKVYDIVATSEDIDSIPALYGLQKMPTFTLTEGKPAYINASTGNFKWQKKVDGVWEFSDELRFTPGEWRAFTSVRIDRENGLTHELAYPTTLTVNGEAWTSDNNGRPTVSTTYSCAFFVSPTYVIEDDPNVQPPIPVESVQLRMDGYEAGRPVADASVFSDDNISVDDYGFIEVVDENGDGMPEDAVPATGDFSTDKIYAVMVNFTGKTGYDISGLTGLDVSMAKSQKDEMEKYNSYEDCFEGIYLLEPLKVYKVFFSAGEGKGTMETVNNVCGDYILPDNGFIAPEGKQFKAWLVNGEEKTVGDTIDVSADVTLIAIWETAPAHEEHSMLKIITPASMEKAGQIQHFCEFCSHSYIEELPKIKEITLVNDSYSFDGKAKKPSVEIFDAKGKILVEGKDKDYVVKYSKGRKKMGKYTVTITFVNNYSGKIKKAFTVGPKRTKISSLTGHRHYATVKWNKQTKKTNGYEIQYSTSKKFAKAKTKIVKGNAKTTTTLNGLKAKKKYYVRVRTYKTVKKVKCYSGWSKAKKVKIK